MAKKKLQRFAELESFERVIQPGRLYLDKDHDIKTKWGSVIFKNENPIVLELGCGRGEYTINLAKFHPHMNFIGIDIKGARLWRGAKTANEENLLNAAFLRIQIEQLSFFFVTGEVSEIWITFPDPQPQQSRENKRLTSPGFLLLYKNLLARNGRVHLKTDNNQLYQYTMEKLKELNAIILFNTDNLYEHDFEDTALLIKTTYEKRFLNAGIPICYICFSYN